VAGTDTTANTLSWAAHLLATTPDVQQKAYDEISAAACRPGGLEALFDASNDKYARGCQCTV
jgi:cytochrome P450